MYECVKHDVDFLLAGSIRDDGPLPDVITDVMEAQRQMRAGIRDVTYCLMIATMLHSVAVGNLLPAWIKVICIDINPSHRHQAERPRQLSNSWTRDRRRAVSASALSKSRSVRETIVRSSDD